MERISERLRSHLASDSAPDATSAHDYKPPGEGLNGHQIYRAPELWSAHLEAYLAERGLPFKRGNQG